MFPQVTQLVTEALGLELRTVAPKPPAPPSALSPHRTPSFPLAPLSLPAPISSLNNSVRESWEGFSDAWAGKGAPLRQHLIITSLFQVSPQQFLFL